MARFFFGAGSKQPGGRFGSVGSNTGGRIFDFTGDDNTRPVPGWATAIGKKVSDFFTDKGPIPIPDYSDVMSVTGTFDDGSNMTMMPNMWRVHEDRKSMYKDIERMDGEDEYVSTALDIIGEYATNFHQDDDAQDTQSIAFRVTSKDPKVQQILNDLIRRLQLQTELYQIIRSMVKHGDYLPEVLVDKKKMLIVKLKQTICYQIYPIVTPNGDKLPGWVVMADKDVYNNSGQEIEEWQICPFQFGTKKGDLSVPLLSSARRNWVSLSKVEDSMRIARMTRAYDKLVHRIPIQKEWTKEEAMAAIKRYRDSITRRKIVTSEGDQTQQDAPLDVQTDFYLPDLGDNKGGISLITSNNAQLGNLNDVYYMRERLLSRLTVPIAYLQVMSTQKTHLKAGVIGDADLRFASFMRRVVACGRLGLVRLFNYQLSMQGVLPVNGSYEGVYTLEMARIQSKDPLQDAKISLTNAQAAVAFVTAFGAIPAGVIASKFFDLDPSEQDMMTKFLAPGGQADQILDARIAAIKLEAEPPPTPAAPVFKAGPKATKGANNNPRKNTSTPKKQSQSVEQDEEKISLDAMATLFYKLQGMVDDAYRAQGVEVPELTVTDRSLIEHNLMTFIEELED